MAEPITRIFLLGLRGTGKSTVAPILAAQLGWAWCDMDVELEQRFGQSVRDMFALYGEEVFRERESALLRELAHRDNVVIATGGGVVLRESNRLVLKKSGLCVWLRASVPVMLARLQNDPRSAQQRPSLTNLPLAEEIASLLQQRQPFYEACADLILDTDLLDPTAVAVLIGQHLERSQPSARFDSPQ